MGTRGAIVFVAGGEEKVCYNHYDSYPEALGENVARWLRCVIGDETGEDNESVNKCRVMSLQAVENGSSPTDAEREKFAQYWDKHVSTGDDWYSLLRNTQGEPALILQAQFYEDAADFPLDSLFCEWAYVIDFDNRFFEVYEGFNHKPAEGRWAHNDAQNRGAGSVYYPVTLRKAYSFDELPDVGEVGNIREGED